MPPSKPAYDVDWIWSNNSDVHVASHRDWFTSYTPFSTSVSGGFGNEVSVAGIGDVKLPTKTHPTKAGTAFQGTIILRDVLYAPSGVCNIIGSPILDDYDIDMDFGARAGKVNSRTNGARAGLLNLNTLIRLRLRGQTATQSSLDPDSHFFIRANWPPDERAKWESFRSGHDEQGLASHHDTSNDGLPLTQQEKKWLKDNHGDEFHFLREHGLSIYKDEDRDEGRAILRAMMQEESSEDSDGDSTNSFLRDLENDPSSHVADYHFSQRELGWIKAHYGHSSNFLVSYGLKFYDDGDCQEGKAIVQAFLSEDPGISTTQS